jgi:SAM-dependent MidA family methyltransferase
MKQRIIDRIARSGPMRFDTYMDTCLYDPDGGYFSAGSVRPGTGSDFVTSPEVSPAFGALIAGWATECDSSGNAALIEIGAGSGALMREIAPGWLDNGRRVYAVEISGASRGAIAAECPGVEVVASFEGLPVGGDAVIIANEVLDNLPCALARRRAGSWVELAVDADSERLVLVEVAARREVVDWCNATFSAVDDGTVVSVQIAAGWFIEGILKRFGRSSLCIIDYGASSNDLAHRDAASLVRTYRAHETGYDWLEAPGATDITVDVNLTAIEAVVVRSGAQVEISKQRDFLIGRGAAERIREAREREELHAADGDVMSQLVARSERVGIEALIDGDGLGGFQVILIESGT